jgi:hypothetical protein
VLLADYLSRCRGKVRSLRDWERYGELWKAARRNKTLREVRPGDVERHRARRLAEGLAEASVNREMTFLRRVFYVAIKDKLMDTNPVLPELFFKESNQRVATSTTTRGCGSERRWASRNGRRWLWRSTRASGRGTSSAFRGPT